MMKKKKWSLLLGSAALTALLLSGCSLGPSVNTGFVFEEQYANTQLGLSEEETEKAAAMMEYYVQRTEGTVGYHASKGYFAYEDVGYQEKRHVAVPASFGRQTVVLDSEVGLKKTTVAMGDAKGEKPIEIKTSTDMGETWQTAVLQGETGEGYTHCYLAVDEGDRGYLIMDNLRPTDTAQVPRVYKIYETKDGGKSWQPGPALSQETMDWVRLRGVGILDGACCLLGENAENQPVICQIKDGEVMRQVLPMEQSSYPRGWGVEVLTQGDLAVAGTTLFTPEDKWEYGFYVSQDQGRSWDFYYASLPVWFQ